MIMVTQTEKKCKRYLPHEVVTKTGAVNLYRTTGDIDLVCRRYHVSKASLMRWNKRYDGTRESLVPKPHTPHSPHPNAHTEQEITWILNYLRANSEISVCELYGKLLREKGYRRHPGSLSIGCLFGWDTGKDRNPQTKSRNITGITTRLPSSERSGRWM